MAGIARAHRVTSHRIKNQFPLLAAVMKKLEQIGGQGQFGLAVPSERLLAAVVWQDGLIQVADRT
jgi:hypothetical protein